MQYVKLGRTGVEVSPLCLGTMNFGPWTSEADSFAIMDRALDLGINFFDTANIYGSQPGETESIVGRWMAQGGGRRDRIVLATKVHARMGEGPNRQSGLSAYKIKREIDESLQRLGTDHVDLYQMHQSDRSGVEWEELWEAFEDLVRAGKVVYVGSSNFAGWEIARAQGKAEKRGFLGLVSEQHKYNLVTREPELEVLPCCKKLGVAVIPFAPISHGFLAGKALAPESDKVRSSTPKVQFQVEKRRDQLEAYAAFCRKRGFKEAEVALAWILCNDAITSPIVGPRTVEHIEGAVRALELKLDDEALAELDRIFPGPGGQAPQAYQWPVPKKN